MTNTALLVVMALAVGPAAAGAGQTSNGQPSAGQQTEAAPGAVAAADAAAPLPVSLDRIRKGLQTDTPQLSPIQRRLDTEDGVPRFAVRTQAPRTLDLGDFLASTTAVPAYVRPPFDPYHYEFLDMVTPENAKGCAQFSNAGCAEVYAGRAATGLMWQHLVGSGLRGLFARP